MNCETLNNQTNKIRKGTAYIKRPLVDEESGRGAGDKRNVEASLIVAANERANPTEQNVIKREAQDNLLKNYALKKTHLKKIEPHHLQELVYQDVSGYL